MLCFMLFILFSAYSLQITTCTVTNTPYHLPVNLNCLFIHVSRPSSFTSFKQYHSSLLLVLVHSAIVPSVPLRDSPSTPRCLFTYSYIPAYSMCLSLSFNATCCCPLRVLSLLVLSLPPHSTQSTHTIFTPSTFLFSCILLYSIHNTLSASTTCYCPLYPYQTAPSRTVFSLSTNLFTHTTTTTTLSTILYLFCSICQYYLYVCF